MPRPSPNAPVANAITRFHIYGKGALRQGFRMSHHDLVEH